MAWYVSLIFLNILMAGVYATCPPTLHCAKGCLDTGVCVFTNTSDTNPNSICMVGYYGRSCDMTCPSRCFNIGCSIAGDCLITITPDRLPASRTPLPADTESSKSFPLAPVIVLSVACCVLVIIILLCCLHIASYGNGAKQAAMSSSRVRPPPLPIWGGVIDIHNERSMYVPEDTSLYQNFWTKQQRDSYLVTANAPLSDDAFSHSVVPSPVRSPPGSPHGRVPPYNAHGPAASGYPASASPLGAAPHSPTNPWAHTDRAGRARHEPAGRLSEWPS